MLHVKQIREIVDAGQTVEGHEALDQLLALGPNNTEALKLRAQLLEFEGRFADESKVWERVATIDQEDPDATTYLLRKQLEDREHFYFTDDIPGGGRRFMAYPRSLVNALAFGLMGCVVFLMSTRLAQAFPILAKPSVMLAMFGSFVLLPWLSISLTYFRTIKAVTINHQGISVATRMKLIDFKWSELEKVCLARSNKNDHFSLSLVLMPKNGDTCPVEIDLNQGSSAIRARSYLVREIARSFSEPEYTTREALKLEGRKIASF